MGRFTAKPLGQGYTDQSRRRTDEGGQDWRLEELDEINSERQEDLSPKRSYSAERPSGNDVATASAVLRILLKLRWNDIFYYRGLFSVGNQSALATAPHSSGLRSLGVPREQPVQHHGRIRQSHCKMSSQKLCSNGPDASSVKSWYSRQSSRRSERNPNGSAASLRQLDPRLPFSHLHTDSVR